LLKKNCARKLSPVTRRIVDRLEVEKAANYVEGSFLRGVTYGSGDGPGS
jgi:hypothetical protein